MEFWRYSDHESPRVGFLRAFTNLGASGHIVFNSFLECLTQLINRSAREMNYIADTGNIPMKCVIARFKFKRSNVAFVVKSVHSSISIWSRKRRTDLTAPLSRTGLGCGRWIRRITPSGDTNRTRDPSPSSFRQPIPSNSASTAAQAISSRSGLDRMASRVFLCLLFIFI